MAGVNPRGGHCRCTVGCAPLCPLPAAAMEQDSRAHRSVQLAWHRSKPQPVALYRFYQEVDDIAEYNYWVSNSRWLCMTLHAHLLHAATLDFRQVRPREKSPSAVYEEMPSTTIQSFILLIQRTCTHTYACTLA